MTENPFAAPATTTGIDWKTLNGRLLLIEPLREETISTSFGESNAVYANVVVLDGPDAPERHDETIIFPKVLANQVRPKLGQKVLGRLGQGQAKSGQSAPWLLQEATAADIQVGTAYLSGTLKAPAASAAAGQPPF